MKENRQPFLTQIAGWGILLVVLGHSDAWRTSSFSFSAAKGIYSIYLSLIDWIYTFHMPLFFVISGYLFLHTHFNERKISLPHFWIKKVKRLLVPYMCISTLAYFPKVFLSHFAKRPIDLGWTHYWKSIFYPWDNPVIYFWFLPTLFVIFIFAPLFLRFISNKFSLITLTILFFITYLILPDRMEHPIGGFFNIVGVAHYFIFFWGGMLLRLYQKLETKIDFYGGLAWVVSIGLWLLIGKYANPSYGLLMAWLGILGSWWLAKKFAFLLLPGNYSYQIYLLSWFPQIFFRVALFQMLHANLWLCAATMFLSGVFIPILVVMLYEKYLPASWRLLIGRS